MAVSFELEQAQIARFAADLDALVETGARVGVAVSGGPDSLALLLLAARARPSLIEAVTVDHGLRPESGSEAEMVAAVCARLGVRHRTLAAKSSEASGSNLQAWAREARYALLAGWAVERNLVAVATAHHMDDQAETLLMRIARGSGVGGLAGVQRARALGEGAMLVRPLLNWRRAELRRIVDQAGLEAVDDPSNSDQRFDRSHARALLEATEWLDPRRISAVASHARDAEEALAWIAAREFARRHSRQGASLSLDAAGLPRELKRRLLVQAIDVLTGETPPGPKVATVLGTLDAGGTATVAGLKLQGGTSWSLSPAPPRKR